MNEILFILLTIALIFWSLARKNLKKLRLENQKTNLEVKLLQVEKSDLRIALRQAHAELFQERVTREVQAITWQQESKHQTASIDPQKNTN